MVRICYALGVCKNTLQIWLKQLLVEIMLKIFKNQFKPLERETASDVIKINTCFNTIPKGQRKLSWKKKSKRKEKHLQLFLLCPQYSLSPYILMTQVGLVMRGSREIHAAALEKKDIGKKKKKS